MSDTAEDGIAKRLRWVVENRAGGNARELARKANLAAESHVSLILVRGGEHATGTILARIAEAGGVHLAWLVTGTEPRDLTNAHSANPSADRFEAVLREKGWSLRELGRRAGLHESHAVKLAKRGLARAEAETVLKIADVVGVNIRWLLTGEGPRALIDPVSVVASAQGTSTAETAAEEAAMPKGVDAPSADELPPAPPKERKKPVSTEPSGTGKRGK